MSVEIVTAHLDAVWRSDWEALENSIVDGPILTLPSGELVHSEMTVGGLYRHISQAWDFSPGTVRLSNEADGIVSATMCLTNGGEWIKRITGTYQVANGMIEAIELADSLAEVGRC